MLTISGICLRRPKVTLRPERFTGETILKPNCFDLCLDERTLLYVLDI